MWKQQVAKAVRLGFLLFVLFVFAGIGSHRHLLNGAATFDIALALGCVVFAISPVFITMGFLMAEETAETENALA